MRFTEDNFPILKTIKNGGLEKYEMGKAKISEEELIKCSSIINNIFETKNIFYLCDTVRKYINDDTFNLGSKMEELLKCDLTDSGVILRKDEVTIVYNLVSREGKIGFQVYHLGGDNILLSMHTGVLDGLNMDFQDIYCELNFVKKIPSNVVVGSLMTDVIFKRFAPIETVIINKETNRRTKLNKEKYVNEVKQDITVIDSNWFTTIIRSKGFGVKGHFGLRACGKNHQDRRVVWIDSYKKNGYIRKAKKHSQY